MRSKITPAPIRSPTPVLEMQLDGLEDAAAVGIVVGALVVGASVVGALVWGEVAGVVGAATQVIAALRDMGDKTLVSLQVEHSPLRTGLQLIGAHWRQLVADAFWQQNPPMQKVESHWVERVQIEPGGIGGVHWPSFRKLPGLQALHIPVESHFVQFGLTALVREQQ